MFGDKKSRKDTERSLISETVSIDGTVNSSGSIDIAGLIKGPVFSKEVVIKETGSISGAVDAELIEVYGHLDGKNHSHIHSYVKKESSSEAITVEFSKCTSGLVTNFYYSMNY